MGTRILTDPQNGAALYDSTSGIAFGPVFDDRESAETFQKWATENDVDLRIIPVSLVVDMFDQWNGAYRPNFRNYHTDRCQCALCKARHVSKARRR